MIWRLDARHLRPCPRREESDTLNSRLRRKSSRIALIEGTRCRGDSESPPTPSIRKLRPVVGQDRAPCMAYLPRSSRADRDSSQNRRSRAKAHRERTRPQQGHHTQRRRLAKKAPRSCGRAQTPPHGPDHRERACAQKGRTISCGRPRTPATRGVRPRLRSRAQKGAASNLKGLPPASMSKTRECHPPPCAKKAASAGAARPGGAACPHARNKAPPSDDSENGALAGGLCEDLSYTMPWAIMASATFLKPAMLAPMT